MQRGEVKSPVQILVLIVLTCGIYGIVWLFQLCQELNEGLGEEQFDPVKELLLSVVTCGVWGYYFLWRVANATYDLQVAWNVEPEMEPVVLFLFSLLGLGPFFIQTGLNNAWEHGSPTAAGHVEGDGWDDRMDQSQ